MKPFLSYIVFMVLLLFSIPVKAQPGLPNFVIIFCDDLGYGDLACYGNELHRTPHLDQLASEGIKFTSFYVSSGVCTPSRASLMTGCYAQRVDLEVNARPWGSIGRQVLFPVAKKGLNPAEITLPEALKARGYTTACVGKWHLGDQDVFLPTRNGFDYYYGIPYSNDMNRDYCPLPLMLQENVVEAPVNQNTITRRYTEEAIRFIETHHNRPFLLYLSHAMTHNPLHASKQFRGKSANGIYGDAVEEIDWSTGQIIKTLEKYDLEKNTLVIFTSDNGAARRWGGTNEPLSGWKASTMEGGMRVPCIMWWPENIPSNQKCDALVTSMDLYPTLINLAGGQIPDDRIIDGKNIHYLMKDPSDETLHEVLYYYQKEQLQAVRSGKWKLHLAMDSTYLNIHRGGIAGGRSMKLIDLSTDIKEEHDLSGEYPQVIKQLLKYADEARKNLGDMGYDGIQVRKAAIMEEPTCQKMKE